MDSDWKCFSAYGVKDAMFQQSTYFFSLFRLRAKPWWKRRQIKKLRLSRISYYWNKTTSVELIWYPLSNSHVHFFKACYGELKQKQFKLTGLAMWHFFLSYRNPWQLATVPSHWNPTKLITRSTLRHTHVQPVRRLVAIKAPVSSNWKLGDIRFSFHRKKVQQP